MNDRVFEPELLNKRERTGLTSLIPYIIIFSLLISIMLFNATYQRIYVVGASMEDTLYGAPGANPYKSGGEFVYIFDAKPKRGDIAVIRKDSKVLIKRVIAVGGDRIKMEMGKVYINDEELYEPYISSDNNNPLLNNFSELTVEENHIFVLGDNRNISSDSRNYGSFPIEAVVGVVAEWSLKYKGLVTAVNTFFEFTLPSWFGVK